MKHWQQRERALELLSKEVGYVRKPHGGKLRVALAFPNTYFVGMSNLGFQTVYKLFNAEHDIVCERVFLPPKTELAAQLVAGGGPLWNLYGPTETTIWSTVDRVAADAPVTTAVRVSATSASPFTAVDVERLAGDDA